MKKLTLIVTISILSLFMLFTSCGNADNQDGNNENNSSETTLEGDVTTGTHVHKYGEWVTVSEPTCKESGTKERTCSCGSKETEDIPTVAHKYVNNVCSMCKQSNPDEFVPDYSEGEANVVGGDSGLSRYVSQGSYLYFSASGNTIDKIKINKSGIKTVYKVTAGRIMNVNVLGDWVYFYCEGSTVGKSYIARVRTDGSGFEKIVSSVAVWEMIVAKDTVYYTTFPTDGEYKDFAKDVMPLYCVSVNGGTPKQIHDGAVGELVADDKFIYFIHDSEDGDQSIRRIKHGNTSSDVLVENKEIYNLAIEGSKLYFFEHNKYDDIYSLASVATNGGGYTVFGKVMQYSDSMCVVGNKAYYIGGLYSEDMFYEEMGLVEYDLTTKGSRIVREDYEIFGFEYAGNLLIFENYDYEAERLDSLTIYFTDKNVTKNLKIS